MFLSFPLVLCHHTSNIPGHMLHLNIFSVSYRISFPVLPQVWHHQLNNKGFPEVPHLFPWDLGQQQSRTQIYCLLQVCFQAGTQHMFSVIHQPFHYLLITSRTLHYWTLFNQAWHQVIFHPQFHHQSPSYTIHTRSCIIIPTSILHIILCSV